MLSHLLQPDYHHTLPNNISVQYAWYLLGSRFDRTTVASLGVPCVMDGYGWARCAPAGEKSAPTPPVEARGLESSFHHRPSILKPVILTRLSSFQLGNRQSHLLQGVIINGAIRDSGEIAKLSFGCKALGTMPRKSEKKVPGAHDSRNPFRPCSPGSARWVVSTSARANCE